ncbi:MAG: hypothetical protein QGI83_14195 [Candidatus Latescibacteria bacterium]|nr:hypothetical protein [Candidatus Latescibacterota bacterium]
MTGFSPPLLSLYDPAERTEGSIDPLGLMSTYERLAERIYPWMTVRMARPRFLTAMVVGAHVCQGFAEELAADDVSPAWLVFEWHIVEGFARSGLQNYPGSRKSRVAVQRNQHLSKDNYLKTPKVFGYSGVYRRLARGLEILDDNFHLDEGGLELLSAWEKDQRLSGFITGQTGPGAKLLESLRRAVRKGMAKGAVDQPPRSAMWEELMRLLSPDRMGSREKQCISHRLLRTDLRGNPEDLQAQEMRCELFGYLEDHGVVVDRKTEPAFFRRVIRKASRPLRERLERIDAYEGLGRTIEDAFRLILHMSTDKDGRAVSDTEFAQERHARTLATNLHRQVETLEKNFTDSDWLREMQSHLLRYRGLKHPTELYRAVLEHHQEVQREKPPDGKRAWFEPTGEGAMVRPMYRSPDPPPFDDSYVYDYRTGTASTFLRDLGRI